MTLLSAIHRRRRPVSMFPHLGVGRLGGYRRGGVSSGGAWLGGVTTSGWPTSASAAAARLGPDDSASACQRRRHSAAAAWRLQLALRRRRRAWLAFGRVICGGGGVIGVSGDIRQLFGGGPSVTSARPLPVSADSAGGRLASQHHLAAPAEVTRLAAVFSFSIPACWRRRGVGALAMAVEYKSSSASARPAGPLWQSDSRWPSRRRAAWLGSFGSCWLTAIFHLTCRE